MFFATRNLTERLVTEDAAPWAFVATEVISAQIRGSKIDRTEWYQNTDTKHHFYTGIESANLVSRPSKENPPAAIHAYVADYDVPITDARIDEVVSDMRIRPSWVETSLSGKNRRLVWLLSRPIRTNTSDFCRFVLQQCRAWLNLDLLPGLDEKAYCDPTRMYCNGCVWRDLHNPPIDEVAIQAFFVECGRKFRFSGTTDEINIALDTVEAALRAKYAGMNWPSDFTLASQGPSFWVPGSESPVSAIVKPGGMFTFSQHATKPFYSWGDLLGAEFVTAATNESMAKATIDVWWDSKKYWFRGKDGYASHELRSFVLYLKTDCNMSAKPDPNGKSVIDEAVRHVEREQRVDAAVPFVFRPPGIVDFQGQKILNTYCRRAIQPSAGAQKWGPHGEFSFSAAMFDNLFRFNNGHQLPWFLAHWKWLYESALYEMPRPQMNFTLCGDPGKGKTLANREYVGMSVGGYADASDYLMKGAVFNSHLFCVGHWCVDDDTMTIDHDHLQRMQSMFKKMSSNQQHEHNKKFEVSGMLEWMGNTGVSINADFRSTRIISAMDAGSLSKMCLYRCVSDEDSQFTFPSYVEMKKILIAERPALLRWLVDWTPPDYVIRSRDRYGFMAYQEPTLLEQTQQTSTVAPFRETLLEALIHFFAEHKDRAEWTGTVTQLVRLMDGQGSKIRVELVNRYLEQIQREGTIKCENRTGNWNTRLWIFRRADFDINKPVVAPLVPVGDNAHFAAK